MRRGDYVSKLANDIEDRLNLTRKDIQDMSKSEFRDLLKNGYFAQKNYKKPGYRQEPTQRQLDVLNLHYKREVDIPKEPKGASGQFYIYDRRENKRRYVSHVKQNKNGRYIDAKTGRFVSKHKAKK